MGYIKPEKAALDAEYAEVIGALDNNIQEIAVAARDMMYSILPGLTEIIWQGHRIIGYGTGPKKMPEHFCYIAPCKRHVDIGFNYGSELPDPSGLLEGNGKLMRHVKIRSMAELDNPALAELIRYATTHRIPPYAE